MEAGVRPGEQFAMQADAVDQFESGGVDGVAAEVAVEVVVRLQQSGLNAEAAEEEGEDDPTGAAPDDATLCLLGGLNAHCEILRCREG
jgi:hypothetical protein